MGMHDCVCGAQHDSAKSLERHMSQSLQCRLDLGLADSSRALRRAEAFAQAESDAGKRTRGELFQDTMRRQLCLSLAKLRFLQRVPAAHVDGFKSTMQNLLTETLGAIRQEVEDPAILSLITPKLQWLDGIETETKELQHLKTLVPVVTPVPREMSGAKVSTDAEGWTPLQPSISKPRMAYDFKLPDLLARLIKHNPRAREQIYETLVTWRTKPAMNGKYSKVILDMTDGRVFLDDPVLGLQARVSEAEARAASATAPLQIAVLLWADGFNPVHMLTGHYHSHGTIVVMYAIINLSPSIRASIPAIQLATVARESDAKAVGMVELLNGGTTSIGAQVRKFSSGQKVLLRKPCGTGFEERMVSVHVPYATADFPQAAAFLPFKASTSAHQYDRHAMHATCNTHTGSKNTLPIILRP